MAELIETGLEPEYNVTDLAWWEPVADGAAVRLCFANKRHGRLIAQYTVVVAWGDLDKIKGVQTEMSCRLRDRVSWLKGYERNH